MQNSETKALVYPNVKYTPRVLLILLTVEKIECENFGFVLYFSLMPNSKTGVYK